MPNRTKLAKSLLIAFGGTALSCTAVFGQQTDNAPQQLQRVEITGSAIKRLDAETAVPVTVIKAEDIKKQGITTIEQALTLITASQTAVTTSQSVGSGSGGASFASLRGLGQNKTLVLLDGRRIANNAIDGSAPDLNMIPFAALERIEVLRDGASALYGTDAIGGVINFITRKNYVGGTATVGYDSPEHSGGKTYNANIGYGYGDLDTNGFNVFGFVDYQKQDAITASQRPFGSTGNIPSRGIAKSSGTPYPANWSQTFYDSAGNPTSTTGNQNPAGPACNSNPYIFSSGTDNGCRYDYTKWVDLIPKTERISGMLKGDFKLSADTQLGLSYFVTQSKNTTLIAPVPYAGIDQNPFMADGTTPNPYYPGNASGPSVAGVSNFDPTQPVSVSWRAVPAGGRQGETVNLQQRFVAALEGNVVGWDYNVGAAYNQNKIDDKVTGGYTNDDTIINGILNGIINPYSDQQTAAGQAAINDTISGTLQTAKGEVWSIDGHASRDLGDWLQAGRPAALAVGAEYRHEKFSDVANRAVAELVAASTGFDPNTNTQGSRNVSAVYAELNVPLLKNLDVTGALRYDRYSDFGNTTNPKVSFRYQPMTQLLFRGSYSTGFRAPSLYDLYAPVTYTNTANAYNDPVRCADPAHPTDPNACGTQFLLRNGGWVASGHSISSLRPEKSKNFTLGIVVEPVTDLSVGLDFWWVRLKDSVTTIPEQSFFSDPSGLASYFHRNSLGQLSINGQDCPGTSCGYIEDTVMNLGEIHTNGFDLSGSYRIRTGGYGTFTLGLSGTYVSKYEYQDFPGGPYIQNVGAYGERGPVFRVQTNASVSWAMGPYALGLVNHYKSGYRDQNDPNGVSDPSFYDDVSSYSTWDLFGTWTPTKSISITLGVRNLLDQDPPFSNQGATFQVGYDPRYTDPTGRTYYVRGTYSF